GVSYTSDVSSLSAAYAYARESDYRSQAVSVGARTDIADRNLTVGLDYTHNFDSVCDANNDAAQGPLDLKPLGTSQHCFQDGRPRGHRRARPFKIPRNVGALARTWTIPPAIRGGVLPDRRAVPNPRPRGPVLDGRSGALAPDQHSDGRTPLVLARRRARQPPH